MTEHIQPNRNYTLKEVRDLGLISWARHYQTLRRIIGSGKLRVAKEGAGRQVRYAIRGSSLISYINKHARGLMVPEPKTK